MKKLFLLTLVIALAISSIAAVKPELRRLVIQNRSDAPVSVILGEQYSFYVVDGKTNVFTIVEGTYDLTAYWCDQVVFIPGYDMTKNQRLTFAPCDVVRPAGEPGFLKVTLPYPE
jgi:hypothetical protein